MPAMMAGRWYLQRTKKREGFGVGAAAETANGEVGSDVSSGSD